MMTLRLAGVFLGMQALFLAALRLTVLPEFPIGLAASREPRGRCAVQPVQDGHLAYRLFAPDPDRSGRWFVYPPGSRARFRRWTRRRRSTPRTKGIEAWGWDPAHRPDGDLVPVEVVNLGYVVNVIEDIGERLFGGNGRRSSSILRRGGSSAIGAADNACRGGGRRYNRGPSEALSGPRAARARAGPIRRQIVGVFGAPFVGPGTGSASRGPSPRRLLSRGIGRPHPGRIDCLHSTGKPA